MMATLQNKLQAYDTTNHTTNHTVMSTLNDLPKELLPILLVMIPQYHHPGQH